MKPVGPGRPGSPGFPSSPGIPGGPGGPTSPLIPKKQTYVDIVIQYCFICPNIYLYTIVSFILAIKNFTTSLNMHKVHGLEFFTNGTYSNKDAMKTEL